MKLLSERVCIFKHLINIARLSSKKFHCTLSGTVSLEIFPISTLILINEEYAAKKKKRSNGNWNEIPLIWTRSYYSNAKLEFSLGLRPKHRLLLQAWIQVLWPTHSGILAEKSVKNEIPFLLEIKAPNSILPSFY